MAQEHQSLQLIDTVYTESTGWRRNQDLITALPYVDLITDEEKLTVDALIEEEVRPLQLLRIFPLGILQILLPSFAPISNLLTPVQNAKTTDALEHQTPF
jgi:hypothetical protein